MTNSLPWAATLPTLVRAGGLEPPRFASLEPKSSASANSATPAAAAGAATATGGRVLTTATSGDIASIAERAVGGLSGRAALVRFSSGSQQVADRARGSDPPLTPIRLVIGLDIG
jgi:hypothetical protein